MAYESLRDDRSQKTEDRRRLEREGDEIMEMMEKHEEKEEEKRKGWRSGKTGRV